MPRPRRIRRRCRSWPLAFGSRLAGLVLGLAALTPAAAQSPAPTPPPGVAEVVDQLARRLEELEKRNAALADQNASLNRRVDELNQRLEQVEPQADARPAVEIEPLSDVPTASIVSPPLPDPTLPGPGSAFAEPPPRPKFRVGEYDEELGAFVLVRASDAQRTPFELRFDIITQARYMNFARSREAWFDAEGERQEIRNFDSFEVARNFLMFSGFAIDPKLQFTAIMFSSTSIDDTVYLGWINYRFSKAFDLRVGNWLLPGTREWYEPFRYTLGSDRLMATTFFRPNISPGIWAQGEPVEGFNYVAMLANSLSRFSQGLGTRVGSSLAFGGTVWWEPTDDFGFGVSDFDGHEHRSYRFGTNINLAHESNQGFTLASIRNPEDTLIRLSDGTPLFRPGVLAPGVELASTNVQLWTLDAAMKYRGLGISGEYFFRWLNGFRVVGGRSPYDDFFDHGGLLQAGYFLKPHKLEAFARTSYVTGRFGGGSEYGGGLNWYPRGTRTWRTTFEVLRINGSPAQNFITGYRAGETGTLFQLQWLTDF